MANFEVERLHAPCVALHDRFKVRGNGTNYTMQYSHIYTERTKQMKQVLGKLAAERWPETPIAERVIDAEGTKNAHDWAIIGVVYKEMKLRSSVLDEFKGSGTGIISAVDATKTIWSDDDFLVLEDESGRVTLGGDTLPAKHMVSGVVLAVRGCVDSAGVFQVTEIITYDQSYANAPLSALGQGRGEDQFLMIVSGLAMGRARSAEEMVASADTGEVELARQLLLDWLSGRAGGEAEAAMASKVVRLIIAGDSIDVPELDREAVAITYGPARTKLEKEHQTKSSNIIKRFDSYLALGLGTVPIDVMPGGSDPSVQIMPQQPLHPCLLPLSSRFSSLSLVTNPYDFRLGAPGRGCRIIGHSGQPLTDILSRRGQVRRDTVARKVPPGAQKDAAMGPPRAHRPGHSVLLPPHRWGPFHHIFPKLTRKRSGLQSRERQRSTRALRRQPVVLRLRASPNGQVPDFAGVRAGVQHVWHCGARQPAHARGDHDLLPARPVQRPSTRRRRNRRRYGPVNTI
jgi:DNA polymerase delta subunit 2